MNKLTIKTLITCALISYNSVDLFAQTNESKHKTPYQIIDDSKNNEWRMLDEKNTLYLTLESGTVVVETYPKFAPIHVENTKNLVKEGVFDNTYFYRVIDNFVAQGGPEELSEDPKKGKKEIKAEFTHISKKPLLITPLNAFDGYAHEVGYLDGFTVGRNKDKNQNWLLHCYGAFAMGRANDVDTGGTELYIVNGNPQRYLDRNTTVFGRVVAGMEHIQKLKRSQGLNGNVDVKKTNKIISIKLASDVKAEDRLPLQIMKTNSQSFKALITSRKNRHNQWFKYQHNYIDVCSVVVPVRIKKANKK